MCNAYEQDQGDLPLSFSEVRIKLKMPDDGDGDERPREAYPRLKGKFLRRAAGEPAALYDLEEVHGRFGLVDEDAVILPPGDHKTPAYNNARSETVARTWPFKLAYRRRCIVPMDAVIEWFGPKGKRTRARVWRQDGEPLIIAGLWNYSPRLIAGALHSYCVLTTEPGGDIQDLHERQPVILEADEWRTWLDPDADPTPLFRKRPAGLLAWAPAPLTKPPRAPAAGDLFI
jgi:putative SOS response-associated peptidase YedK